MAHKDETTTRDQSTNAPDFLAWHVSDRGGKSWWSRVGAAWAHKDGAGFTLQLEMLPIGGRIVLRQPLDNADTPAK